MNCSTWETILFQAKMLVVIRPRQPERHYGPFVVSKRRKVEFGDEQYLG